MFRPRHRALAFITWFFFACCSAASPPSTWPRIRGWQLQGPTVTFTRENLWDAINGAADFYLAYGFKELTVTEHERAGIRVSLSVYDQSTLMNAFGIYRRQRSPDAGTLDAGAEATIVSSDYCTMLSGQFFVQAQAVEGQLNRSLCEELLRNTATALGGGKSLPEELSRLPTESRVSGTEGFTAKSYLGFSEIGNALHAKYRDRSGSEYEIFVILDKSPSTAQQFLNQLPEQWQQAEVNGSPARFREIPYRGYTIIVAAPQGMYGIVDAGTLPASKDLLSKRLASLR